MCCSLLLTSGKVTRPYQHGHDTVHVHGICIYAYVYTYIYIYTHTCVYVCVCVYVYIYIYCIYIYAAAGRIFVVVSHVCLEEHLQSPFPLRPPRPKSSGQEHEDSIISIWWIDSSASPAK